MFNVVYLLRSWQPTFEWSHSRTRTRSWQSSIFNHCAYHPEASWLYAHMILYSSVITNVKDVRQQSLILDSQAIAFK